MGISDKDLEELRKAVEARRAEVAEKEAELSNDAHEAQNEITAKKLVAELELLENKSAALENPGYQVPVEDQIKALQEAANNAPEGSATKEPESEPEPVSDDDVVSNTDSADPVDNGPTLPDFTNVPGFSEDK